MQATRHTLLRLTEWTCWTFGLVGLAWWGSFQAGSAISTTSDIERFAALRNVGIAAPAPDQSLWSPESIIAWQKARLAPAAAPVAVLRIDKLRLEVAVLPGTDDLTLDRAVGLIEGTSAPGTGGNIGIAGHRDSFFRGLKDIAPGDLIELVSMRDTVVYRVEQTWIVDPTDVSVLDPVGTQALTLVTCYPFYFVGPAPRRFIVRAVPAGGVAS